MDLEATRAATREALAAALVREKEAKEAFVREKETEKAARKRQAQAEREAKKVQAQAEKEAKKVQAQAEKAAAKEAKRLQTQATKEAKQAGQEADKLKALLRRCEELENQLEAKRASNESIRAATRQLETEIETREPAHVAGNKANASAATTEKQEERAGTVAIIKESKPTLSYMYYGERVRAYWEENCHTNINITDIMISIGFVGSLFNAEGLLDILFSFTVFPILWLLFAYYSKHWAAQYKSGCNWKSAFPLSPGILNHAEMVPQALYLTLTVFTHFPGWLHEFYNPGYDETLRPLDKSGVEYMSNGTKTAHDFWAIKYMGGIQTCLVVGVAIGLITWFSTGLTAADMNLKKVSTVDSASVSVEYIAYEHQFHAVRKMERSRYVLAAVVAAAWVIGQFQLWSLTYIPFNSASALVGTFRKFDNYAARYFLGKTGTFQTKGTKTSVQDMLLAKLKAEHAAAKAKGEPVDEAATAKAMDEIRRSRDADTGQTTSMHKTTVNLKEFECMGIAAHDRSVKSKDGTWKRVDAFGKGLARLFSFPSTTATGLDMYQSTCFPKSGDCDSLNGAKDKTMCRGFLERGTATVKTVFNALAEGAGPRAFGMLLKWLIVNTGVQFIEYNLMMSNRLYEQHTQDDSLMVVLGGCIWFQVHSWAFHPTLMEACMHWVAMICLFFLMCSIFRNPRNDEDVNYTKYKGIALCFHKADCVWAKCYGYGYRALLVVLLFVIFCYLSCRTDDNEDKSVEDATWYCNTFPFFGYAWPQTKCLEFFFKGEVKVEPLIPSTSPTPPT